MGEDGKYCSGDGAEGIRNPVIEVGTGASRGEELEKFVQGAEGGDEDDGRDQQRNDGCRGTAECAARWPPASRRGRRR